MAVVDSGTATSRDTDRQRAELAGLDALETPLEQGTPLAVRLWSATWPKIAAVVIALGVWEAVARSGWKPEFLLPSPFTVLDVLWAQVRTATLWEAVAVTMRRGIIGFAIAIVIGAFIGVAVSRSRVVRAAIGSLITGFQTMPSIAWLPASILLFGLEESAITFVVVIGAAPSVANGIIHGIDHIPPLWLRAGKVLGARGLTTYRHVVLPAAMPSVIAGLKQGWAFAWRSLMAGELLVIIANRQSLGQLLQFNREVSDAPGLYAVMIVILVIGVVLDGCVFGVVERRSRRRRGLQ
jgi:NitT/TauT family transport system permease protein